MSLATDWVQHKVSVESSLHSVQSADAGISGAGPGR